MGELIKLIHCVVSVLYTFLLLLSPVNFVGSSATDERLYQKQFPEGAEYLPLPRMVLYSVYMGEIHYPHVPFLLTSMKWNANVNFVIINIYNPTKTELTNWKELVLKYDVPNLHVEYITLEQFSNRVYNRLNVRIPFDDSWYYKMCDFKPTLAYLFPEFSRNDTYAYWGYADLDVVWGNITKFSYLFQKQRPFVISGWWHTTGALNMFINEDWTQSLFLTDPKYVPMLTDPKYRNMDENGMFLNEADRVDSGMHSMMYIENHCTLCQSFSRKGMLMLKGKTPDDTLFIGVQEYDWGGHSIWSHGSLTMPAGNKAFPPHRELMFYHVRKMELKFDHAIYHGIVEDMLEYGFTLPHFYPLFTRFACRNEPRVEMENFQPYAKNCFASKLHLEHQQSA